MGREPSGAGAATLVSPEGWAAMLAPGQAPARTLDGGALRHFRDTAPVIDQPPLDHHYLALHLGGAKQVHRNGEGPQREAVVAVGSITMVPAGAGFRWQTRGPIDYAHLYIAPQRLARTVRDTFDRDPARVEPLADVGRDDPLLAALMTALLDPALDGHSDGRLARESWFEALLVRLVQSGSTLGSATPRARNALTPRTLTRLKTYIEAHLAQPVTLEDLAAVAGLSRFHLCRAFRDSTGLPPHAYLTRQRLALARRLLRTTPLAISEVARACGFASPNQFATSFRKHVGVTPSAFRRDD